MNMGDSSIPLEINDDVWAAGEVEFYLTDGSELQTPKEMDGLDGLNLRNLIEGNEFYLVSVILQAYPNGKIHTLTDRKRNLEIVSASLCC